MGEVVVPPAVGVEVQATLPQLPKWIRVKSLLRGVESHAQWPRALGVGEIEAIALAIDLVAERSSSTIFPHDVLRLSEACQLSERRASSSPPKRVDSFRLCARILMP